MSFFGILVIPSASAVDVTGTVTLLGVCGVTPVTGSPIVYGVVAPYTESSDQTLSITNPGNVQSSISVKGTAWNAVAGPTGVMLVGSTHYTTSSAQPYSSKTALTGTDASLTTLTPLQTKNSFWQLKTDLVSGNADFVGAATQTVTLTASCP
jgi:hypothetical protein